MKKVLVVATSRKTRGGVTSVVRAHEQGKQWKSYRCKWVETHRDGKLWTKLWYSVKGYAQCLVYMPFYDIVHFHTSEPPSALRKCPLMAYAKLWRKKTIVHFHAFSPETTVKSKYQNLYRYLFRKADRVVVLSETWRQYVNDVFQLEDKVRVIYNPCTAEIFPEKYARQKQILYAGTVNARKGYADMIKAFSLIAKDFPDWKIVFAGNGEIEEGMKLARQLDIEHQTVFLGWVKGSAKDKAFKESLVFCLPSYAEGFPMAVLDAWAYGLPVITTPVGGIPDIAEEGKNMLLFAPGDVKALAQQMKNMIVDKKHRELIADESLRLARTTFNITTINQQVADLYAGLF